MIAHVSSFRIHVVLSAELVRKRQRRHCRICPVAFLPWSDRRHSCLATHADPAALEEGRVSQQRLKPRTASAEHWITHLIEQLIERSMRCTCFVLFCFVLFCFVLFCLTYNSLSVCLSWPPKVCVQVHRHASRHVLYSLHMPVRISTRISTRIYPHVCTYF